MTREEANLGQQDSPPQPRLGALAFALLWIALTLAVLALDYATGPRIRFPVLLLVPLSLVAWRYGLSGGVVYAAAIQIPRLAFAEIWNGPWNTFNEIMNSVIRLVTFAFVAALVAIIARQQRALRKEVQMLRGILPICMYCKKIRNAGGEWEQLEVYISHHSQAQLSHGICAECAAKHYPELASDNTSANA